MKNVEFNYDYKTGKPILAYRYRETTLLNQISFTFDLDVSEGKKDTNELK